MPITRAVKNNWHPSIRPQPKASYLESTTKGPYTLDPKVVGDAVGNRLCRGLCPCIFSHRVYCSVWPGTSISVSSHVLKGGRRIND